MIPIVFRHAFRPRGITGAAALCVAVVAANGCATADQYMPSWRSFGVYKLDVNQGNYLSQDMVDKLKVGMTPGQVKTLLGTPLVNSPFRPDRWDYVYEYSRQGRVVEHRNFTVYFAENKLARWEGDEMPQSVVELNRSASAKALPTPPPSEKSSWDRFLDVFRP
jgi:outer membrane protein assembly factor BamE (lipoprotein component of BamABCDE complex)